MRQILDMKILKELKFGECRNKGSSFCFENQNKNKNNLTIKVLFLI